MCARLLATAVRFYLFKKNREEHLGAYFFDLIFINSFLTAVFIRANSMYFDPLNHCSMMSNQLNQISYWSFCALLLIGYLQFVYCILLSCYLPLSAIIIYQLIDYRLTRDPRNNPGLIGGLIQIPLPIPEIINTLKRT